MREKNREASAASSRSPSRGPFLSAVIAIAPNRIAAPFVPRRRRGLIPPRRPGACVRRATPPRQFLERKPKIDGESARVRRTAATDRWRRIEGERSEAVGKSMAAPAARMEKGLSRAAWLGLFACVASIALVAMQAFAAARLELTFDEAYYTLWSRSLAFGYLDHPPMVAVLIRASTAIFGDSSFGVRALSLLLVASTPALVAWIAWRLFGSRRTAAYAAILWIGMPLVMAGAVFV